MLCRCFGRRRPPYRSNGWDATLEEGGRNAGKETPSRSTEASSSGLEIEVDPDRSADSRSADGPELRESASREEEPPESLEEPVQDYISSPNSSAESPRLAKSEGEEGFLGVKLQPGDLIALARDIREEDAIVGDMGLDDVADFIEYVDIPETPIRVKFEGQIFHYAERALMTLDGHKIAPVLPLPPPHTQRSKEGSPTPATSSTHPGLFNEGGKTFTKGTEVVLNNVDGGNLKKSRGVCESWDDDSKTWRVRVGDQGTIVHLPPEALELANTGFAEGSQDANAAPSDQGTGITPGCHIRVDGLCNASHLNGKFGIVKVWVGSKCRWLIQINGDEEYLVKAENIQVLSDPSAGSANKSNNSSSSSSSGSEAGTSSDSDESSSSPSEADGPAPARQKATARDRLTPDGTKGAAKAEGAAKVPPLWGDRGRNSAEKAEPDRPKGTIETDPDASLPAKLNEKEVATVVRDRLPDFPGGDLLEIPEVEADRSKDTDETDPNALLPAKPSETDVANVARDRSPDVDGSDAPKISEVKVDQLLDTVEFGRSAALWAKAREVVTARRVVDVLYAGISSKALKKAGDLDSNGNVMMPPASPELGSTRTEWDALPVDAFGESLEFPEVAGSDAPMKAGGIDNSVAMPPSSQEEGSTLSVLDTSPADTLGESPKFPQAANVEALENATGLDSNIVMPSFAREGENARYGCDASADHRSDTPELLKVANLDAHAKAVDFDSSVMIPPTSPEDEGTRSTRKTALSESPEYPEVSSAGPLGKAGDFDRSVVTFPSSREDGNTCSEREASPVDVSRESAELPKVSSASPLGNASDFDRSAVMLDGNTSSERKTSLVDVSSESPKLPKAENPKQPKKSDVDSCATMSPQSCAEGGTDVEHETSSDVGGSSEADGAERSKSMFGIGDGQLGADQSDVFQKTHPSDDVWGDTRQLPMSSQSKDDGCDGCEKVPLSDQNGDVQACASEGPKKESLFRKVGVTECFNDDASEKSVAALDEATDFGEVPATRSRPPDVTSDGCPTFAPDRASTESESRRFTNEFSSDEEDATRTEAATRSPAPISSADNDCDFRPPLRDRVSTPAVSKTASFGFDSDASLPSETGAKDSESSDDEVDRAILGRNVPDPDVDEVGRTVDANMDPTPQTNSVSSGSDRAGVRPWRLQLQDESFVLADSRTDARPGTPRRWNSRGPQDSSQSPRSVVTGGREPKGGRDLTDLQSPKPETPRPSFAFARDKPETLDALSPNAEARSPSPHSAKRMEEVFDLC